MFLCHLWLPTVVFLTREIFNTCMSVCLYVCAYGRKVKLSWVCIVPVCVCVCVCEVRQLGRPVIIFITLATRVWLCFGSWVQSSLCVWIVHPKSWIPAEEFSLCRCELPWLISMPILGPTQASFWTGKLSEELLPNVIKYIISLGALVHHKRTSPCPALSTYPMWGNLCRNKPG